MMRANDRISFSEYISLVHRWFYTIYISRFICRKRDLSYNRVLHGITNAKTKEADTYNVKNDIKNRLTTLVFIIVLILMGIMFNVIP